MDVPVDCQRAVIELAGDGLIGAQLMPVPLGYRPGMKYDSPLDPALLDKALIALGTRLESTEDESQRVRRSRIILAEKLLEIRGNRPLGENVAGR